MTEFDEVDENDYEEDYHHFVVAHNISERRKQEKEGSIYPWADEEVFND